ncbi:MAG: calcium-binding protein [Sphingomonas fennica]
MATIDGTAGNDTLTGTTGDDLIRPLTGIDTVDGGGGVDTLIVDYSRFVAATGGFPSAVTLDAAGFSGFVQSRVGADRVDFARIATLDVRLGDRGDWFVLTASGAVQGRMLALDGGGGIDRLTIDAAALTDVSLIADAAGRLGNSLGWRIAGFEEYAIATGGGTSRIATAGGDDVVRLGSGTNSVATGDGTDTILSTGGRDAIDAGAGRDFWRLDLGGTLAKRTLVVDGVKATAAVAGLASVTGVERVEARLGDAADTIRLIDATGADIAAGPGNDVFTVSGGGTVTIDGGAGTDAATITLSGAGHHWESELRSNGAGGYSGALSRYTGVTIADIEAITATLSDADDLLTVDAAPLALGARLKLNGGGGQDHLTLDLSGRAAGKAIVGADGVLRLGESSFAGFESFRLIGSAGADQLTGGSGGNVIDGGAGNDLLKGGGGRDMLIGGAGNDKLYGLGGLDDLAGGTGDDIYYLDSWSIVTEQAGEGRDTIYASVSMILAPNVEQLVLTGLDDLTGSGTGADDAITGNAGANMLYGEAGRDTLSGGAGADHLIGGAGADVLTGGAGADAFVFTTLEGAGERDTVKDFRSGEDVLIFDRAAFTALTAAGASDLALAPGQFTIGRAATTADHHLIYNSGTGALYYDADGAGGLAQVQIAQFAGRPALTADDLSLW